MEQSPTKWGLEYTLEYPDISPIYQPCEDNGYERKTWGRIVWSFLESGRELMKVTPPDEIDIVNSIISLNIYLRKHPDLPVSYYYRKKKMDNYLYLIRLF